MATTEGAGAQLAGLRSALGASSSAAFQWPWDIAHRGGSYFSEVTGVASALVTAAQAVVASPDGPSIVAGVTSNPTDGASADRFTGSSVFGPALDAIRADSLLRCSFVGWSAGAQVGLFGGGGGSGVATDVVSSSTKASVSYGAFKMGIGAQVAAGLLVGAMAREPSALNASTCIFEFGAGLVGIGTFVAVIMDGNLDLIGFTVLVGAGGGFATSTGYGSISAG